MKSDGIIRKWSISIGNRKTSVSMEELFWERLKLLARLNEQTIGEYIERIGEHRRGGSLSSACRLHVLEKVLGA